LTDRQRKIFRDAFIAVFITIVLICVRELLQNYTYIGQRIEFAAYNIIQDILASKPIPKDIPITIVDLSGLEIKPIQGAKKGETATPRMPLLETLENLANLGAWAIAVDVDFSPDGTYRTPEDPVFFQKLLDLRRDTRVPIYLGVGTAHRLALSREQWLLNSKYQDLGVSILVPKSETLMDMPECFQIDAATKCSRPTLSGMLVQALKEKRSAPPEPLIAGWLEPLIAGWLVEQLSMTRLSDHISVGTFPVDYSALADLINNHTIRSTKKHILEENVNLIAGHVVLLGDARPSDPSDTFRVPGWFWSLDMPGVYLHACAVYTLWQAPLYQFKRWPRLLVDVVLALAIIVPIVCIRLYYARRTCMEVAVPRLQWVLTGLVVVAVLLTGAFFVDQTRLLWDDFLLVIFAFLMHPAVEKAKPMTCWLRRSWHSFLFEKKNGQE
jgi:CHASE2 domain-containing sensor protein